MYTNDYCADGVSQSNKMAIGRERSDTISGDSCRNINRVIRKLDMTDFACFLAVGESGSFRKAAVKTGLGQSAVSRRIQKLEDLAGVSLFERHPTGATLTPAGWTFAEHARSLVGNLQEAIDCAHNAGTGRQGQLGLGIIASLSQGPIRDVVAEFFAKHPNVEFRFVEGERSELVTMLSHRRLDVVIASGEFASEYGDSLVISEERIYLAVPEQHKLSSRSKLSWDDLYSEHFLVSADEPGPEIHEYIIRRLADLGRRPRVTRYRICREGLMNLIGLGLGVGLVAEHWCGVTYPSVVFRPVGYHKERVPFSVVWRPDNDNPALRRFVSLARVHAKKAAASLSEASQSPDPSP